MAYSFKLLEAEIAYLVVVLIKAGDTAKASFKYFNDLHKLFAKEGKDWSAHVKNILHAGKDERYNALKKDEVDAREVAKKVIESMVGTYTYLKVLEQILGWDFTEADIRRKIESLWRDDALDALRKDFESETSKAYRELTALPRLDSMKDVPVGSHIFFFEGYEKSMFEVVRKTPTGRQVSLKSVTTDQTVKLVAEVRGYHAYSFVIVPQDRVEYLKELSVRWKTALKDAGIEEIKK